MKNLPPITDHAFMRMLRDQCRTTKPMSRIAAELGVDVDDLCAWIMEYAPPKRQKPYVNRQSPPLAYADPDRSHWSATTNAQRFMNWQKAQKGAAETIRMLEMSGK